MNPHDGSTSDVVVCSLTDAEWPRAEAVLQAFPFGDYRRYRSLSKKALRAYLAERCRASLSSGGIGWVASVDAAPVGVAVLAPLGWETRYFERKMAGLSLFVVEQERAARGRIADALVSSALAEARGRSFEHLSARVDVEDVFVLHALERSGFHVMDTLLTFGLDRRRSGIAPSSLSYTIRPFEPGDTPAVLEIASRAFRGYKNRFVLDASLPEQRSERFYLEWTERCCDGSFADRMLVAVHRDRVVGFVGWRVQADLVRHGGGRIMGGGLGACTPRHIHAYPELVWAVAKASLEEADAVEADTQAFNVGAVRSYTSLGFFPVRAKYTLHAVIRC